MEEELPRVPRHHPLVGPSAEEAGQQSEEAQLRELRELLGSREDSKFAGEEGPERAELAEQLRRLEQWLRMRGAEEQQEED